MNTNQARAYEEIDPANGEWTSDGQIERIEETVGETDAANGVIRLRLCLRDRTSATSEGGKTETGGRKRGKKAAEDAGAEHAPPPRPRIVWRREDANETRPAPAIVME